MLGGIFNNHFVGNFLQNLRVKEFFKVGPCKNVSKNGKLAFLATVYNLQGAAKKSSP